MFGSPETTPGGKALKFYASVRIDIRRREALKDSAGQVVGNHVKTKIVKNKVAPPFAEAEFDIMYNQGINKQGSIIDAGLRFGVLTKKGAWIQHDGELIGQGVAAALPGARLSQNPHCGWRSNGSRYSWARTKRAWDAATHRELKFLRLLLFRHLACWDRQLWR